ncbi:MAG: Rossmann fold nucleotide-binding protein [Actinomycetota bacterium]
MTTDIPQSETPDAGSPGSQHPGNTGNPTTAAAPDWLDEVVDLVGDLATLGELPYDPTPGALYTAAQLYRGFDDGGFAATMDQRSYARAQRSGQPPIRPREALAQRLHDHGITVALDVFRAEHRLVGVMGGHALVRGSEGYAQGVALGRAIATDGYCVVTGGGPGAMEAANLGAATANLDLADVDELHNRLAAVPGFAEDPDGFIRVALEVAAELSDPVDNLSVPTWFYGHEPSNPFASHIAKYFSNSEREDGLLAIALSGIVFLAGGPGTIQEVFQDAAQNAYRTFGDPAPMVFLNPPGKPDHWDGSGVLAALDTTFTDYSGNRRPGWDLVAQVHSVEDAVSRLKPIG